MPSQRAVLFAADDLAGGTGIHLQSLSDLLVREGVTPTFLCFGPLQPRADGAADVILGPPRTWIDRYPIAQLRRWRFLRRVVRDRRPDLVHSVFFWSVIYGRLLKAAGSIGALVENREDQGFNWGSHEYAWLRRTGRIPDRVICVSEAVRRTVVARERIDPARVSVIHNGIRLPAEAAAGRAAARRALGYADDDLVVGMVSNLNRSVKGVSYFIQAATRIRAEEPRARFVIVGGGPDEPALRREAEELGLGEHLRFAGFQPDVRPYYEAMDLSVLTSLSEGLSITLLESQGYGLPVVVTAVGGNPEVVIEGATGHLVPPRDVAAFASAVVGLLRDPARRRAYGAAGRARIAAGFSLERVAGDYARVYREVLEPRAR